MPTQAVRFLSSMLLSVDAGAPFGEDCWHPEPFMVGELAMHYERHRVTVAGRKVALTATEYELLRVLSVKPGRVCSYEALLREVWGETDEAEQARVRSIVKKLRRKLSAAAPGGDWVLNEYGVGYGEGALLGRLWTPWRRGGAARTVPGRVRGEGYARAGR